MIKIQNNSKNLIEPMDFFDPPPGKLICPLEFDNLEKEALFFSGQTEETKDLIEPMDFFGSPERALEASEANAMLEKSAKKTHQAPQISAKIVKEPIQTEKPDLPKNNTKSESPVEVICTDKNAVSTAKLHVSLGTQKTKPLVHKPSEYELSKMVLGSIFCFMCEEQFYIFDAKFYKKRTEREMHRMIKTLLEHIRIPLIKTKHINEIVKLLYLEESIIKRPDELNQCEIAFDNGVLNIHTGAFYPHSPNSLVTYLIECNYHPTSQPYCPRFQQFLQEITGGDVELQIRILETIGYILTPDNRGKAIFLFQGVSNSGKSVLCELIKSFFSEEAVMPIDVHNLGGRFIASSLVGKALCISADMTSDPLRASSTSKLKQLSGGDFVSAEVRYTPMVSFYNRAKFILATNHPLLTSEQDDAFVQRIVTIPFDYATPPEKRDRNLLSYLKAEKDGIAALALSHYFQLVKNNYNFTGDYPMNASIGILRNDDLMAHIESNIYKMTIQHFEPSNEDGIFTEDAHAIFVSEYGYVDIKYFSNHFARYANENYNAEKIRRRRTPDGNPISYIKGIKMRGGL